MEYLRYLIETAWDWVVAAGVDMNYSRNPDVFWVIRETEKHILHPLRHNGEFDLTIWVIHWQKVCGTRCFELKFKDSAECILDWELVDRVSGEARSLPDGLR